MSDAIVSKQGLATWLKVNVTTLTQWLIKYGDEFPVLQRGTNGREYKFDAQAVSDFLRAKQEEQRNSKAQRDEALAQLALPFNLPDAEAPPAAGSPVAELAAWRLRKLQREEAEAAAKLMPAAHVAAFLQAAFSKISRNDFAVLRQVGKEEGWPAAFVAKIEARFVEQYHATVATLRQQLGEHAVPPDIEDHARG